MLKSVVKPNNNRKILARCSVITGQEDIFKLTIGNEILHRISNDNCIGLMNFATSKKKIVKSIRLVHNSLAILFRVLVFQ